MKTVDDKTAEIKKITNEKIVEKTTKKSRRKK